MKQKTAKLMYSWGLFNFSGVQPAMAHKGNKFAREGIVPAGIRQTQKIT